MAISSKKSIIFISAIIFICGALTIGLPVICSAGPNPDPGVPHGGHHNHNSDTSYVNVPILNNTGKMITITKMYIRVPGECTEHVGGGGGGGGSHWENEVRVKDIYFGGTTGEPDGTIVFSKNSTYCCCKNTCNGYRSDFNMNANKYDFTGAKILCKIALDVNPAPSGAGADNLYTITYYFRYSGDTVDRTNTITFNLP